MSDPLSPDNDLQAPQAPSNTQGTSSYYHLLSQQSNQPKTAPQERPFQRP